MAGTLTHITRSARSLAAVPVQTARALSSVTLVLCCALTSCSLVYDERPTQCSLDADCNDLEGGVGLVCDEGVCASPESVQQGDAWACLETGDKLVSTQPTVTQEIELLNILTGAPPEQIEVLICQKFDQQCESPSERLTADEDGVLEFTVNEGFDGYLELIADGIMPSRIQFFNVTDQGRLASPPLIPLDSIGLIAETSGVEYDAEKVTVLMELSDCNGRPLRNATGESDATTESTAIRYLVNQVPSTTQESTTEDGLVALFNLEPGAITLRGVRQDGVNFASEGIVAPAGYIVYLGLRPNQ